jgi:hypothetical protein
VAKYRAFRRTLRFLALRHAVARPIDDGDVRYSSDRQLFHVSSEPDTLGRSPSIPTPSRNRVASQPPAKCQQAKRFVSYVISSSLPSWRTYVGDPQPIARRGAEVAFDQVGRGLRSAVSHGSGYPLSPACPIEAGGLHQARDPLAPEMDASR